VHMARPLLGGVDHYDGSGSGKNHNHPDQRGERKSEQRGDFQQESVTGRKVEDNAEGQQEQKGRNHGQAQQGKINNAVQTAPALAVAAGREVGFVVAPHLRRNTGNVIAPAGEDAAHEFIAALGTHLDR